jgi:hypothetical protein
VAFGGDNGNGGPGTTGNIEWYGKLQKSSMVLWQRSRVLPLGTIPAGIPDSVRFRNKLFLPWNDLPKQSAETWRIPKNEAGPEPE